MFVKLQLHRHCMKQEQNTDTHPDLVTIDTGSGSDLYFNINLLCEVHLW